ncbi:MAG: CRISPR-associated endonuclease Cas1 [Desulfobacterales bacterium]|nr:CRISPR-associated endonuclease Cas1 [Desulfobacterales bacterium]
MESMYVLEPGSYLRRSGDALRLVKDGRTIEEIPAGGLKRLMLVGYVSLTGAVMDFLIKNRVETVFVTPTGKFRARLVLDEHRHVAIRKAQYFRLSDPAFALGVASKVVCGKIRNMYHFLMLRCRQYQNNDLGVTAARLKSLAVLAADANSLDRLRGLEGFAAKLYFGAFPSLIRNQRFPFNGRNRRPPLDPVNAMLSFAYTLITNEVLSAVKTVGLDPYLGALHEIDYGRPSLACDLVEEYRTFMADRLVLGLINRQAVMPEDFICRGKPPAEFADDDEMKQRRPVEMKPAVCKTFIVAYEQMMARSISDAAAGRQVKYRYLILNQVQRFARFLENSGDAYEPFSWEI